MKNHIFVLSRYNFIELVGKMPESQKEGSAFISIHEPNHPDFPIIIPDSDSVLNLWFDDVEEDFPLLNGRKCVLFDEVMAERVYEFVQRNREKKAWIIHCTMGKCRSGAVGEFLQEFFEIDYFEFKGTNPKVQPNTLVKNLLMKTLFNSCM